MMMATLNKTERETVLKPWGGFIVVDSFWAPNIEVTDNVVVKRLWLTPGKKFSYQYHEHRSEHWFLVGGEGKITLDGKSYRFKPFQSVNIPPLMRHRLECISKTPLLMIEVWYGDKLSEDDIVRLPDV